MKGTPSTGFRFPFGRFALQNDYVLKQKVSLSRFFLARKLANFPQFILALLFTTFMPNLKT